MSKNLGPRTFGKREELVFLGREMNEERDYGDRVAEEIDLEVRDLTNHAYQNAQALLVEHKPKLVQIAEYLIVHESVTGDALASLFNQDEPGTEGDTGTPVLPPETPTPYAPRPTPQPTVPRPAPSLSSRYSPPKPTTGDATD